MFLLDFTEGVTVSIYYLCIFQPIIRITACIQGRLRQVVKRNASSELK